MEGCLSGAFAQQVDAKLAQYIVNYMFNYEHPGGHIPGTIEVILQMAVSKPELLTSGRIRLRSWCSTGVKRAPTLSSSRCTYISHTDTMWSSIALTICIPRTGR